MGIKVQKSIRATVRVEMATSRLIDSLSISGDLDKLFQVFLEEINTVMQIKNKSGLVTTDIMDENTSRILNAVEQAFEATRVQTINLINNATILTATKETVLDGSVISAESESAPKNSNPFASLSFDDLVDEFAGNVAVAENNSSVEFDPDAIVLL